MKILWWMALASAVWAQSGVPDRRQVIVCFGDSLTAGYGLDRGQSFPDLVQSEIDRHGYKYRVENLGANGDTTQDGLARLSMVFEAKPAIVLLELGANDGLRGQPAANISANLSKMIEALQRAKIKVVLAGITMPPNYGPEYVRQFSGVYPALARKYALKLIPFLLEGVAGNPKLMQQDGLHPNAEGEKIVGRTVWMAIEPLLRK